MEKITNLNQELATRIREQRLVPDDVLEKVLGICNEQRINLGQTLVRQNYISTSDLGHLIKNLPSNSGNLETAHQEKKEQLRDFGDYEIIEEIARGGMGIVYKAKQKKIGREVALKVLLSGSKANAIEVKRFFREAEATAKLQHPGIVPLYQMGKEQGYHFFTMKFIQGTTFRSFMIDSNISFEDKIRCFIRVCQALSYAHDHQILHRDLKPSNILMDQENNPYITDFGLAKMLDSKSALTQTGSTLGTPFYMSPEQMRGDKRKIDARTDIYSMGVILYEILTGELPFQADSMNGLYQKVTSEIPPSPCVLNANISKSFEAICWKALEKEVSQRYASANDLANDLQAALDGKKVNIQSSSVNRIRRKYQQHQKLVVAFAVIVFVLLSVVTFKVIENYQAQKQEFANSQRVTAVNKLCDEARKAIGQNEIDSATSILKKAISKYPKQYQGYLEMGLLYSKLNQTKQAETLFKKAYQLAPDNGLVLLTKSRFHRKNNEAKVALDYLNRYLKLYSKSEGYRERAKVFQFLGQLKSADQDFKKAEEIDRQLLAPVIEKAAKAPAKQAINILDSVLSKSPEFEPALMLRSQIYFKEQNYTSALMDAIQLTKFRFQVDYFLQKALCLEKLGNEKEALTTLQKGIQKAVLSEDKNQLYLCIANLHLLMESPQQAMDIYRRIFPKAKETPARYLLKMLAAASSLDPKKFNIDEWVTILLSQNNASDIVSSTYYYRGLISLKQNKKEAAKKHFYTALKHSSSLNVLAQKELGYILFEQGKWQEARKLLEVVSSFAQEAKVFGTIGSCYFAEGLKEEAVRFFSQAIAMEPWKDEYYGKRAKAYKELKRYQECENDLTKVNQLDPENLDVLLDLADILLGVDIINNYVKVDMLEDVLESGNRFRFKIFPNLFEKDIKNLGGKWIREAFQQKRKKVVTLADDKIAPLITAVYNLNPSLQEFAHNQLVQLAHQENVLKLLAKEKKTVNNSLMKDKLTKAYDSVWQRYLEIQQVYFRALLFRHYHARDLEALREIYLQGATGEKILYHIVQDSQESSIVRYFAGNALFDLCTPSARNLLSKLRKHQDPNIRLIALVGMKKQITQRKDIPAKGQYATEFLNAVFMQNASQKVISSVKDIIANTQSSKVKLYGLKKLRELGHLQSKEYIRFFNDSNPIYQAFAIASYWDFQDKKLFEKFRQAGKKNLRYLIQASDSTNSFARRVAIVRLAEFDYKIGKKVLIKNLNISDTATRFIVVMLLAQKSEFSYLTPILSSPKEPLLIRTAIFSGGRDAFNKLPLPKLLPIFQKLYGKNLEKHEDPRVRMISVSALGHIELKVPFSLLKRYFFDKDRYFRIGSLLAVWKPRKLRTKYAKEIKRSLKDKDLEVRQLATLSTVFSVALTKEVEQAQEFLKKVSQASPAIRRSAAFACRYAPIHRIYPLGQYGERMVPLFWNWEKIYATYLFGFYERALKVEKSRLENLISWSTKGIELHENPYALAERGILYLVDGKYDNALKDFQKARTLDKIEHNFYSIWLAHIYSLKKSKKSVSILKEMSHKYPWDYDIAKLYLNALENNSKGSKAAKQQAKRVEFLKKNLQHTK